VPAIAVLASTGAPGGRRLLIRAGIDPGAAAGQITAEQWHRLALLLAGTADRGDWQATTGSCHD
jgi:hypothetical protein